MGLKILDWIAMVLLIIGGLNIGFVGIFDWDPIVHLFSQQLFFVHIFFFMIGLAAVYMGFRASTLLYYFQPKP